MRHVGLAFLALSGCGGADLRGTWAGDLDCGPVVFEAVVTLDKREKGIFQGPLELHSELTDAQQRTLITDIVYDVEARADKVEAQDLRFEADYASLACEIVDGAGNTLSTDCSDAGLSDADFEDREEDLAGATWDGDATISVEVEDGCAGDLELLPTE